MFLEEENEKLECPTKGSKFNEITSIQWNKWQGNYHLVKLFYEKNQDAERYIEYVTVYKANKWKL